METENDRQTLFASRGGRRWRVDGRDFHDRSVRHARCAIDTQALIDPVSKYPKPPLQKQSRPGLAGQMDPPPDHGEHSYRGSGRLTGRKALITGGDSGMGRAAAIAFAREGADVASNYYPTEEPDAREVMS